MNPGSSSRKPVRKLRDRLRDRLRAATAEDILSAAEASFANPFKSLWIALKGVRTEGPMAPEISLDGQRPAQYVFSRHVQQMLAKIGRPKVRAKEPAAGS